MGPTAGSPGAALCRKNLEEDTAFNHLDPH